MSEAHTLTHIPEHPDWLIFSPTAAGSIIS